MWIVLLDVVGIAAGIGVGLALGLYVKDRVGKSRRGGSIALAASIFMALGHYTPRQPTIIQEPSDHMKTKKGNKPGDPPVPV